MRLRRIVDVDTGNPVLAVDHVVASFVTIGSGDQPSPPVADFHNRYEPVKTDAGVIGSTLNNVKKGTASPETNRGAVALVGGFVMPARFVRKMPPNCVVLYATLGAAAFTPV